MPPSIGILIGGVFNSRLLKNSLAFCSSIKLEFLLLRNAFFIVSGFQLFKTTVSNNNKD